MKKLLASLFIGFVRANCAAGGGKLVAELLQTKIVVRSTTDDQPLGYQVHSTQQDSNINYTNLYTKGNGGCTVTGCQVIGSFTHLTMVEVPAQGVVLGQITLLKDSPLGTFQFTFQCGDSSTVPNTLTVIVVCGLDTLAASTFINSQTPDNWAPDHSFNFPNFIAIPPPGCNETLSVYEIWTDPPDGTVSTELFATQNADGTVTVLPVDTSLIQTYTFWIRFSTTHALDPVGPCYLNIVCGIDRITPPSTYSTEQFWNIKGPDYSFIFNDFIVEKSSPACVDSALSYETHDNGGCSTISTLLTQPLVKKNGDILIDPVTKEQEMNYTFWVRAYNAFNETCVGPYLLSIFCPPTTLTESKYTLDQQPDVFANDYSFVFPVFTASQLIGCYAGNFLRYELWTTDTSGVISTEVTTPIEDAITSMVTFEAFDKTLVQVYTFWIHCYDNYSNITVGPNTLTIVCGPQTVAQFTPSALNFQQFKVPGYGLPYYTFTNFTSDPDSCVLSYSVTGSRNDPNDFSRSHFQQNVTHTSPDNYAYIQSAYETDVNFHEIYIVVWGGASNQIFGPLTLEIVCGDRTQIYPSDYFPTQTVYIGAGEEFFSFGHFTSELPTYCENFVYTIWATSVDENLPAGFTEQPFLNSSGLWEFWPSDLLMPATYSFLIHVVELNGGSTYTSSKQSLVVSCAPFSTILTPTVQEFYYEVFVRDSNVGRSGEYEIFIPRFLETNPNCPIIVQTISAVPGFYVPSPHLGIEIKGIVPEEQQGIIVLINTSNVTLVEFYAYNMAQGESQATSAKITFKIVPFVIPYLNMAPFLAWPPQNMQFDLGKAPYRITLPEILDVQNNFCTIEIKSTLGNAMYTNETSEKTKFDGLFTYDFDTNVLVISDGVKGSHRIDITLTDIEDATSPTYSFTVTFVRAINIAGLKNKTNSTGVQLDELPKENYIVTAKFESIDQYGHAIIKFNSSMNTEHLNLTDLDSTVIDLYIVPYNNWHLDEDNFKVYPSLNFTWIIHSFKDKYLKLNLTFYEPIQISPREVQDMMIFHIIVPEFFTTGLTFKMIDENYRTLPIKVRKQMADSSFNRNFKKAAETTQKSIKGGVIGGFLVNFIMAASLSQVLGMVNSLQLIVHLPIINVNVPACVMIVENVLIPIVTFDFIDLNKWKQFSDEKFDTNFIYEDEEDSFIPDQMQNIGYESTAPSDNLGTIAVVVMLYYARVILFFGVVVPIAKLTSYGQTVYQKLKAQLFFGEILIIILEGYLDFSLAFFLFVNYAKDVYPGNYVILSWMFVFIFIIGPGAMIYVLIQPFEALEEPTFQERYGYLYEEVRTKSKKQMMFHLVFMIRRLLFVIINLELQERNYFQVLFINYLDLAMIMFLGSVQPFKTKMRNFQEIVNECFLCISSFHFMLFTDFVPDKYTQYNIGWSLVVTMMCHLSFNLYFVLKIQLNSLGLICIKYGRRADKKLEPVKLKVKEKLDAKILEMHENFKNRFPQFFKKKDTQELPQKESNIEEIKNDGLGEEAKIETDDFMNSWNGQKLESDSQRQPSGKRSKRSVYKEPKFKRPKFAEPVAQGIIPAKMKRPKESFVEKVLHQHKLVEKGILTRLEMSQIIEEEPKLHSPSLQIVDNPHRFVVQFDHPFWNDPNEDQFPRKQQPEPMIIKNELSEFEVYHEVMRAKQENRKFDASRVARPQVPEPSSWEKFCQEMENLPSPNSSVKWDDET